MIARLRSVPHGVVVVVAIILMLGGILPVTNTIRLRNQIHATQRAVTANRRAIAHSCALATTLRIVFLSAIQSNATLPDRTADQVKLLAALRRGVREIDTDRACEEITR